MSIQMQSSNCHLKNTHAYWIHITFVFLPHFPACLYSQVSWYHLWLPFLPLTSHPLMTHSQFYFLTEMERFRSPVTGILSLLYQAHQQLSLQLTVCIPINNCFHIFHGSHFLILPLPHRQLGFSLLYWLHILYSSQAFYFSLYIV